jgi:hypothetical protein
MLASFPASMLNQNQPDLGILYRFRLDPSRSRTKKTCRPIDLATIFPRDSFSTAWERGVSIPICCGGKATMRSLLARMRNSMHYPSEQ